ncbi:MAG: PaaI family thioesterase [Bradyrhizobium sp.]
MTTIIIQPGTHSHARPSIPQVKYGVTPPEVMASMAGLDFVRAIFDGSLPAPPIMQTIEPFDSSAEPGLVVVHSIPGFRHYNPIGSVHGGYAATLLDSVMGLAIHTMLPPGSGYTTLEFKISFIKGMTDDSGPVRSEGRILSVGRRAATAEARITDAKGRLLAHATTTCLVFEIPKATAKGTSSADPG